jgi:hypothetical protein
MPYSPIRPPVPRSSAGFWKARNQRALPAGPYRPAASLRPWPARSAVVLAEVAEGGVQGEEGVGGPLDRGLGRGAGLDGLEGGHHLAGRRGRPGRRGGHGLGHPDVAADHRDDAELAQRRALEPLLGGGGVGPGLVDQRHALVELAGLEAAGAGEQGPGRGQVVLDQLGLAHGLPGDDSTPGQDQGEHHHDEQTTHEAPLRQPSIGANDAKHYLLAGAVVASKRPGPASPRGRAPVRRVGSGAAPGW